MTTLAVSCMDATGRPKARYISEAQARRALKGSNRWRRRSSWPCPYLCHSCKGWHVGHPREAA